MNLLNLGAQGGEAVRCSAWLGGMVMTINEREAKANNDSDRCEHRIEQGRLGTEQRPNAAAPKEKNQRRRNNAEQHCKERERPQWTNATQQPTHSEKNWQIQSEERESERQQ